MQRLVEKLVQRYQMATEAGRRLRAVFIFHGLNLSCDEESCVCALVLRWAEACTSVRCNELITATCREHMLVHQLSARNLDENLLRGQNHSRRMLWLGCARRMQQCVRTTAGRVPSAAYHDEAGRCLRGGRIPSVGQQVSFRGI